MRTAILPLPILAEFSAASSMSLKFSHYPQIKPSSTGRSDCQGRAVVAEFKSQPEGTPNPGLWEPASDGKRCPSSSNQAPEDLTSSRVRTSTLKSSQSSPSQRAGKVEPGSPGQRLGTSPREQTALRRQAIGSHL